MTRDNRPRDATDPESRVVLDYSMSVDDPETRALLSNLQTRRAPPPTHVDVTDGHLAAAFAAGERTPPAGLETPPPQPAVLLEPDGPGYTLRMRRPIEPEPTVRISGIPRHSRSWGLLAALAGAMGVALIVWASWRPVGVAAVTAPVVSAAPQPVPEPSAPPLAPPEPQPVPTVALPVSATTHRSWTPPRPRPTASAPPVPAEMELFQ